MVVFHSPPQEGLRNVEILGQVSGLAVAPVHSLSKLVLRDELFICPAVSAVFILLSHIYAFADSHRDRQLIAIGADSRIDETERPVFEEISGELEEIIKAAMALRYAQKET